jgi:hypothetical protein
MKRFRSRGENGREGREVLSFEGGEAGARTFSRRQAIGLLGGSLAGVILLSTGLAAPAKAVNPFGIRGPAGYTIPQLRYVRGGNWYNLTLGWKCVFQLSVVNHKFATAWTLREDDGPFGADDWVDATVPPHQHGDTSPAKVFIPSQANPSNPQEVSFKETIIWHRDDLDTEIGNEELYAWVKLRDLTTNSGASAADSNQLNLSP